LKDEIAYVQAGAGIVYDSDPSSEYQETLHKAKALLEVSANDFTRR
jgi:anthranilate synthase component 1